MLIPRPQVVDVRDARYICEALVQPMAGNVVLSWTVGRLNAEADPSRSRAPSAFHARNTQHHQPPSPPPNSHVHPNHHPHPPECLVNAVELLLLAVLRLPPPGLLHLRLRRPATRLPPLLPRPSMHRLRRPLLLPRPARVPDSSDRWLALLRKSHSPFPTWRIWRITSEVRTNAPAIPPSSHGDSS